MRLTRLASDYLATGYRRTYDSEPSFENADRRLKVENQPPKPATPAQIMGRIEETVRACTNCRLHLGRKKAVPGEGVCSPRVMIIGEAPGEEEDAQGKPFVGTAGQYLAKWMDAIGISRGKSYMTNMVKCKPPQNRQPSDDECAQCFPYLEEQIAALKPAAILCVGLVSSRLLTRRLDVAMATLRDRVYEYKGTPLCVTYHPSAVLRDQTLRKIVWEDLKRLQTILEQFPETA